MMTWASMVMEEGGPLMACLRQQGEPFRQPVRAPTRDPFSPHNTLTRTRPTPPPPPPAPQLPRPSIAADATKSLTIVVPAYNEEDRLPATLDETLE
jgi:hypothetical protein